MDVTGEIEQRFWDKARPGATPDDCWLWSGWKINGYPHITVDGKAISARRLSYFIATGVEPPPGSIIIDNCNQKLCVNPDHLRLSDPTKIAAHRVASGRDTHSTKGVCKNGHPYNAENTHLYKKANGQFARKCRACHRMRSAMYYAKKTASMKD